LIKKIYGEFRCKECGNIFFQKHLLDAHKSIHTKEQTGPPKCRKCNARLTTKNWMPSMAKASSRVCKLCMKKQNKENYRNRKIRIMEELRERN